MFDNLLNRTNLVIAIVLGLLSIGGFFGWKYSTPGKINSAKSFRERVTKNKQIDKHLSELVDMIGADRGSVFLVENYEQGISSNGIIKGQDCKVGITNVYAKNGIESDESGYEIFKCHMMMPVISCIEDQNGYCIIADTVGWKQEPIKSLLVAVNGLSGIDYSLIREGNGHRKAYMIGAIAIIYVKQQHEITDIELMAIRTKAELISNLIENEYQK